MLDITVFKSYNIKNNRNFRMNAWEKMRNGLFYDDFDDDLFDRRVRAKAIFREYNRTTDGETEKRVALLKELFESVGKNVWIEPDFKCEYGGNISFGSDVYVNFGCIILDCAKITIGSHVLIGPNVGLYAANHAIDPEERANGLCVGKPITIEDKVWLGGDVKIVGGVTIGEGSVIGTGSVVTKEIPPRVVAAGNPCKVLRKITKNDKQNPQV